ncbi:MAG: glycerate kinase [Bacteroidota bacterium]
MRILIAPNSMKGSLDALAFAEALASGLRRSGGPYELILCPVADGGDHTGPVLAKAMGLSARFADVRGPFGQPVRAPYYLSGIDAVVELADASGMKLCSGKELNPLEASTFGTGQLILEAIRNGARELILGIGGSATVDGGSGCLEALGFTFRDLQGNILPGCGRNLERITTIEPPALAPFSGCRITVACDVDNPLCGENGAARVYAPQKGAGPEETRLLEKGLLAWRRLLSEFTRGRWNDHAMCGAAGGCAAGLEALAGARLTGGAELVLKESGFNELLPVADLVITGEGRIDSQTGHLKAPMAVAQKALQAGKKVIAVAGTADNPPDLFNRILLFRDMENDVGRCMMNAPELAERAGFLLGQELKSWSGR